MVITIIVVNAARTSRSFRHAISSADTLSLILSGNQLTIKDSSNLTEANNASMSRDRQIIGGAAVGPVPSPVHEHGERNIQMQRNADQHHSPWFVGKALGEHTKGTVYKMQTAPSTIRHATVEQPIEHRNVLGLVNDNPHRSSVVKEFSLRKLVHSFVEVCSKNFKAQQSRPEAVGEELADGYIISSSISMRILIAGFVVAILLVCFGACSRGRTSNGTSDRITRLVSSQFLDRLNQASEPAGGEDPYERPADEDSTSSDTDIIGAKATGDLSEDCGSHGPANVLTEFGFDKVNELVAESNDMGIDFIQPKWNSETVAAVLTSYGIDTRSYTKQSLAELARELSQGKAQFCRSGHTLCRVVDLVIILVVYEPDHLVIQELSHPAYRRNFGEIREKTIKGRLMAGESFADCASRCLDQKLGFPVQKLVRLSSDILHLKESTDFFEDSMPGLASLTRFYVVEANVIATEQADLEKLGLVTGSLKVADDYMYRWESIHEIRHVRKHLREKWKKTAKHSGGRRGILDHTLVPLMPWTLPEVRSMLNRYNVIDCISFCGMDVKDLYHSLSEGKLSLGVLPESSVVRTDGHHDGQLVCVLETVSVVVKTTDKQMLVCTRHEDVPSSFQPSVHGESSEQRSPTETTVTFNTLPSVLPTTWKLSNESTSMAALRVAQTQFNLRTPIFKLEGRVLSVIDKFGSREACVHREHVVPGPWLP